MNANVVTKVIERIENEQIAVKIGAKEVIAEIVSEAGKQKMYELGNDESIDTFVRNVYFDFEFVLMNKPYEKEKELTVDDAYELAKQYGFDIGRNDIGTSEVITDEASENDDKLEEQVKGDDKSEEQVKDNEIIEEPIFDIDKEIEMMFMEARGENEQEASIRGGLEQEDEVEQKEEPKEEPKEEQKEEGKAALKDEPQVMAKEEEKQDVKDQPQNTIKDDSEDDLINFLDGYTKSTTTKVSSSEKVLTNNDKKNQKTVVVVQPVEKVKEKYVGMQSKQPDTAQIVKQIAKHTEKLLYYRLTILSFKGNLATLDKEIAKIYKNYAYKSALIENAKKNCVQVYSENVSLSKIEEEKKMLDTVGFVTELQELSIKNNAVIDWLNKEGMLIKGFRGCGEMPITQVYQFEEMNHINSVIGKENIKNIEYTEVYETPLKKVKYNKNGMVKIPFLGAGNAYLIFTDTRIIISEHSELRIIDKTDVEEVSSAFEKKTFSFSYGQIQVTMKNGNMLILVLSRKDFSVEAKNEFDTRVPLLKWSIK